MANLESLPNEVLIQIVESLESNRCAAAVSQTNHRFSGLCDLSTRRKYHRVRLEHASDILQAHSMMRSILRKPHLGLYVNHLRIVQSPHRTHPWSFERLCDQATQPSIDPPEVRRLELAISRAGYEGTRGGSMILNLLQTEPNHIAEMTKGEKICWAQALATVLTVVSPNLSSLAISHIWTGATTSVPVLVFTNLLQRANEGEPVPYFHRLRNVQFLSDEDHQYYNGSMDEYNSFRQWLGLVHRIPSLQRVRLDAIMSGDLSGEGSPLRQQSATYTEIVLNRSMLRWNYQHEIIAAVRTLKAYTYSLGGNFDVEPDKLFQTLLEHRHTLETLDLDIERGSNMLEYIRRDRATNREGRPSDFLKAFLRLKHLSLGPHLLCHYAHGIVEEANLDQNFSLIDSLPESLERLRIYGFDAHQPLEIADKMVSKHDYQRHIIDLMANKQKLPRLNVIEGVETMIPIAEPIVDLDDEDADLLWRPDESNWEDWEACEF